MKNKPWKNLLIAVAIIILGLLLRRYADSLPLFVTKYVGDALWGSMIFFGLCALFPKFSPHKLAIAALLFCYAIEFSQLYQAEWINNIRNTTLGALVLGKGFLWTDLVCYTIGIVTSFFLTNSSITLLVRREEEEGEEIK